MWSVGRYGGRVEGSVNRWECLERREMKFGSRWSVSGKEGE